MGSESNRWSSLASSSQSRTAPREWEETAVSMGRQAQSSLCRFETRGGCGKTRADHRTSNDGPIVHPVGVPSVAGIEREGGAALVAAEDAAQVVLARWIAGRERQVAWRDGCLAVAQAAEGRGCPQRARYCRFLSADVAARRAQSDHSTGSGG